MPSMRTRYAGGLVIGLHAQSLPVVVAVIVGGDGVGVRGLA